MPRRDPDDRIEYVAVAQYGPGNLWLWASNGSLWAHSNFFIRIPPKINTHSVTNFTTPEGGVPITVSPPINGSSCLVRFGGEIYVQLRTTYFEIFRPYSYHRQQEIFRSSAVGVCRFICR